MAQHRIWLKRIWKLKHISHRRGCSTNKILCRNLTNQGKISRIDISHSGIKWEVGKGSNDALIKCSQCSTGILSTPDMSRSSAWMKFLDCGVGLVVPQNYFWKTKSLGFHSLSTKMMLLLKWPSNQIELKKGKLEK